MVIKNKKASFDYEFLEEFISGIVLVGTEVKSIRRGKASIKESYCYFKENELFIKGMHIAEHEVGKPHDPIRERKLLLTKKELKSLQKKMVEGLTIIPTMVFFNKYGFIKLNIALAKGKKQYDKRQAIKRKDVERELKTKIK